MARRVREWGPAPRLFREVRMTDRRAQAIETLASLGCVLEVGGDVEAKAERRSEAFLRGDHLRAFNPRNQCARKVRYATQDEAVKRIRRIENVYLHSYHCQYCKGWHNGNAPRG